MHAPGERPGAALLNAKDADATTTISHGLHISAPIERARPVTYIVAVGALD
jgi:hypothetical protein